MFWNNIQKMLSNKIWTEMLLKFQISQRALKDQKIKKVLAKILMVNSN